jgi:hypothetical protein
MQLLHNQTLLRTIELFSESLVDALADGLGSFDSQSISNPLPGHQPVGTVVSPRRETEQQAPGDGQDVGRGHEKSEGDDPEGDLGDSATAKKRRLR